MVSFVNEFVDDFVDEFTGIIKYKRTQVMAILGFNWLID